ncbi:MAG: adenine phosphoribosyltransferase [Cyclobacteriaceae bacterium]|nr:adenine phosphoribosyltransferase [Cyclobacteriaceae bacterium]
MQISSRIRERIRDVKDFPTEGILFKDITPLFSDPGLCRDIIDHMAAMYSGEKPSAIAAMESRGFIFGPQLARALDVPFIPVRKKGKLPYQTISHSYDLEYGSAILEMHTDALQPGDKIIIHDDLLATGGTADAAAELIKQLKGEVMGFSFLIDLTFLGGKAKLLKHSSRVDSLVEY